MDDAFESMEDQDELEEEAETEVEKVLWELTAGVSLKILITRPQLIPGFFFAERHACIKQDMLRCSDLGC